MIKKIVWYILGKGVDFLDWFIDQVNDWNGFCRCGGKIEWWDSHRAYCNKCNKVYYSGL